MGKTPSSHIIHSLGGWIVQDIEPIRLLKSPRSLSVYIPIWHITLSRDKNANTVLSEMTITLIITTLGNILHFPLFFISNKWIQRYLQKHPVLIRWKNSLPFIGISDMLVSWIVQSYSALVRALASYQSSPSPGINEFLVVCVAR